MSNPTLRSRGFSLVEVLVALSLIGLAGSTLLLTTASTVQSANDAVAQTMARGMAEQLLNEILGSRYHESGVSPQIWPMGPDSGETRNPPRTYLFDDADDFSGYISSPPRDGTGVELGQGNGSGGLRPDEFRLPDNYFAGWTAQVLVTYVDENDPTRDLPPPQTSNLRAVQVRITRSWQGSTQELAAVRQTLAYVPSVSP